MNELVDRSEYLSSLIGIPWSEDFTCWECFRQIQKTLFQRDIQEIKLDPNLSRSGRVKLLNTHPEYLNWQKVDDSPIPTLINAPDGAGVTMANSDLVLHIGVWLKPERAVIHCDEMFGVQCRQIPLLLASGWRHIKFYQPIEK